ncbi:universal stress protein [Nonomuraea helvata]|uniref:universal stress protein n=1 Tax=Nonomuraea helvata TaxID=37484 RepID=UPI003CD08380
MALGRQGRAGCDGRKGGLVTGAHGRGGIRSALLGSVSHGVLHHARCAVAVVRK